nr:MAG TPA: hypothetical protein [Caudoviricetes sp.]
MKFERQYGFIDDIERTMDSMKTSSMYVIYWYKVVPLKEATLIYVRVKGDRILKIKINSYHGYYPFLTPPKLLSFLTRLIDEAILSYYKDCSSVKFKTKFH